jgi:hypothetical protein
MPLFSKEQIKCFMTAYPYETGSFLTASTYLGARVYMWRRNLSFPYTKEQLVWREKWFGVVGATPPGVKRFAVLMAVASWTLDKMNKIRNSKEIAHVSNMYM